MMAVNTIPSGFLGNLSEEQESRLQLLWTLFLHLVEASSLGALEQLVRVNSLPQTKSTTTTPSHSRRNSLILRRESRLSRKESTASFSLYHARLLGTLRDAGLSASETRSVRRFLSLMSPDDIRFAILTAAKQESPDVYLLRFLRFAKWNVNRSFVRLLDSLLWREKEMHVDKLLLPRGELYAVQQSQNLTNPLKTELARGFISQLRMGKCYVRGVDRMNRPVCVIRVRLHQPGAQTEEALNQFITHTIETVRLLATPPVETATVVFDMTGFTLANMEYAPVKFIIKCFEMYYPESLGVLLIHNAPRVFSGIWKVIKSWMDPNIVSKIHFTKNVRDLERFIARDQIVSELGGAEDWEYEYPEPEPEENRLMNDFATRDALLAERNTLGEELLAATSAWITATRANDVNELQRIIPHRQELIEQINLNYWDLDPYVRARSYLDRTGVIQDGARVEMSSVMKPQMVQIQTAKILQVEHFERAQVKVINI